MLQNFKTPRCLTLHIKAAFALRARAHSPQPQPPKMTQTSHRGRVPLFKIDENRVPYLKIAPEIAEKEMTSRGKRVPPLKMDNIQHFDEKNAE